MPFMKDTSQIARRMMSAARPAQTMKPPAPPKVKMPSLKLKKGGKVTGGVRDRVEPRK